MGVSSGNHPGRFLGGAALFIPFGRCRARTCRIRYDCHRRGSHRCPIGHAIKKLADADADVLLVDKHDYHTFQPLLYQVATDLLEPPTVGHPLRDLFHDHPNVKMKQATVTGIDLDKRRVSFAEMGPRPYDYLVLGLGATVNFFGVPGADKHAFPMYTLPDAVRLKDHVLERWTAADRDPDLIELYRQNLANDYPDIPQDKARIVVVEAGDAVLSMFKKGLQTYAKKALEKRTVEIMLGEVVESIEPTRIRLKSGTVLKAHTLIWGAGLQANPLVSGLGLELQHGNRIAVGPDLTVPGHPEVYGVGDIAWITDTKTKSVLPQLGSVALQAGEHAGETILRTLKKKKKVEPFEYLDKGTMATIGRKAAVVQFRRGRSLTGTTAWLAWGTVHLALLSTGEDRARAVVDWTWAGFTHERAGRIQVDATER